VSHEGRFAYEGLDRLLHEKARLGIMTSLLTHPEGLVFGDLKRLCSLTDGNLSRHLQALNSAELIEIWKGTERGRSQTLARLSKHGRERFIAYVEELGRVLKDLQAESETVREIGWAPTTT
jgi:DNA-binding MarR family transcriptional regulator